VTVSYYAWTALTYARRYAQTILLYMVTPEQQAACCCVCPAQLVAAQNVAASACALAWRSGAHQVTPCRSSPHMLSSEQDQKENFLCHLQQLQRLAPQTGMGVPSCAHAAGQHTTRGNATSTSSMQCMLEAVSQHCSGNTRPGKTVLHLVAQALWCGASLSVCNVRLRCGEAGQNELFSALLSTA